MAETSRRRAGFIRVKGNRTTGLTGAADPLNLNGRLLGGGPVIPNVSRQYDH